MFAPDVGAHHLGVELGVKLHADRVRTVTQKLMRITCGAAEDGRAGRWLQYALFVRGVRAEAVAQDARQGVAFVPRCQFDRLRADLAPAGQVTDSTAQGMRHQLMAVANSDERQFGIHGIANPASGAFAPGQLFGDHRRRAGDDGTGNGVGRWQRLAGGHVDQLHLLTAQPGAEPEPVRKVAVAGADGLRRSAGTDDQDGFHPRLPQRIGVLQLLIIVQAFNGRQHGEHFLHRGQPRGDLVCC